MINKSIEARVSHDVLKIDLSPSCGGGGINWLLSPRIQQLHIVQHTLHVEAVWRTKECLWSLSVTRRMKLEVKPFDQNRKQTDTRRMEALEFRSVEVC